MKIYALQMIFATLLATVLTAGVYSQARGTVTVAAAADLQTAFPEIADAFRRATGVRAIVSFGSSGTFFAQIQNGAPFDVFFSADADYPARLAAAGSIERSSLVEYATGGLVLWTRADSGVDVTKGLSILRDPGVRRIAIANPAFAPYGRAAIAALTSTGLIAAVRDKLVNAENVSQAAQLAHSGNADVALIGHALALGPEMTRAGRFVEVPADTHPAITQVAGVVSASTNQANGRALLDFVRAAEAQRILRAHGFDVPERGDANLR